MHTVTRDPFSSVAIPLQGAVLCVNCECVSNGHFDVCPVCGSNSLLGIGHMLGDTPLPEKEEVPSTGSNLTVFDLTITLELKQMNPHDVNDALERITRLIGQRLSQGRACFHINVEPVSTTRSGEIKAA